jgi:exodeoxyribonuclease V beta subunit
VSTIAPLDVFGCALSGTTLIEASAGTGKTWNICGLYLRLLLERSLPVQNILVVTFTKAATAELRERIRARIVEALAMLRRGAAGPDPFVADLLASLRTKGLEDEQIERQLELARTTFDEAAIFTIHGFCQRALADKPFAAQMPLDLELLDNDAPLRREVVNDFWRKRIAGDALSEELIACLLAGSDTPETLDRLLARRLSKPLSILRWPDELERLPKLDLSLLRAAHAVARQAWRARRDDILAILRGGLKQLNAGTYKESSLQRAAADWEQLLFPEDPVPVLRLKLDRLDLLGTERLTRSTKAGCTAPQDPFFDIAQALIEARP